MTCLVEGLKILDVDLIIHIFEVYNTLHLELFRDVYEGQQNSTLQFIIRFKIWFMRDTQDLLQAIALTSLDLVRVDGDRYLILVDKRLHFEDADSLS